MDAALTCCACGRTAATAEGYLRPEGFVCGACWADRLKDPTFVQAMEQQLLGLVATASGTPIDQSAPGDQAIAPPRTERDRRAWESLQGLAVADALGAAFEGSEADPAREIAPIEPKQGTARWTDGREGCLCPRRTHGVARCLPKNLTGPEP